jgi:hemoglobin/transferrin/lactoferrin receptor protein
LRLGYSALYSEFINKSFFPFPFNKAEQNNITYSAQLGLNYLIGKRSKVALNLSSGFRSPNIDDLAKVFDSTPLTLVVPNPSLRPEKTYNIDLSGNIRFSQRLKVQAILFSTAIRDAIITDTFLFDGRSTLFYNGQQAKIFANQNKRSANIQGVTFGIEADILEGLKFESQGTLTKGIINDRSKKPLDHIPPFIMRSSLGYVKHKLSTSIYVLYNGWKRIKDYSPNGEDNQQYAPPEGMPSWWTLNMKSSYQLNNNVSLMFGIENLFDLQYRVFASGINAPGRNVSISGKLIF